MNYYSYESGDCNYIKPPTNDKKILVEKIVGGIKNNPFDMRDEDEYDFYNVYVPWSKLQNMFDKANDLFFRCDDDVEKIYDGKFVVNTDESIVRFTVRKYCEVRFDMDYIVEYVAELDLGFEIEYASALSMDLDGVNLIAAGWKENEVQEETTKGPGKEVQDAINWLTTLGYEVKKL